MTGIKVTRMNFRELLLCLNTAMVRNSIIL